MLIATAKDVAAALNLSVSTVGRALADDDRISDVTKRRVRRAADRMGYVVNRAARTTRGAPSTIVGLLIPDIRNSFYSTVAHALSASMSSRGRQVMLCETEDDSARELAHVRDLLATPVAGTVLVLSARPHPSTLRLLRDAAHVQLLRRDGRLGSPWFGINDGEVIEEATRHLVELGHRRIAIIGGNPELPTSAERLAGFRRGVASASDGLATEVVAQGGAASVEHGRAALSDLLSRERRPTAVVTGTLQATRGVLEYVHRHGVDVPTELSVVGFGDAPEFSWWGPGLTTVSLPMHELATACGNWRVADLRPPRPGGRERPPRAGGSLPLGLPRSPRGPREHPPAAVVRRPRLCGRAVCYGAQRRCAPPRLASRSVTMHHANDGKLRC